MLMRAASIHSLGFSLCLALGVENTPAQDTPASPPVSETVMTDVLVIGSVGRSGRAAVHTDAVEASIVAGEWHIPREGDKVTNPTGSEQSWKAIKADKDGNISGPEARNGYVYWQYLSDTTKVMLLDAGGHGSVYVNGEIRAGNPYGYGYYKLPVLVHAGTNEFLFQYSRGAIHARLNPPEAPLSFNTADATLPDVVVGESEPLWGAVILVNATTNFMTATLRAGEMDQPAQVVSIPPLGTRKTPFLLKPHPPAGTNSYSIPLEANEKSSHHTARTVLNLRIRQVEETCRRTFISSIDDSVQYYGVNGAMDSSTPGQALFLSLHGASVEGMGQADAYSHKKWGTIVSPTNRRPYGFDWEEWGRYDALEVLGLAQARFRPDPSRIYLTGHSMGGHGTWHLGAVYPDLFAAIAPSAGWISFSSYGGADQNRNLATNAIQRMLRRSGAGDETLLMATNYLQEGVYILHGDADDNVPVTEAREMRRVLGGFHRDFDFFEQPGAGHWWDASDEPGADCVDWAPMFDFFARHRIPADEDLRHIRFVTLNPAVSAKSHWVTILAQKKNLEPSYVNVQCDPGKRRISGNTTNISRIWFELPALKSGAPFEIDLDGGKLENIPWERLETSSARNPSNAKSAQGIALSRTDGAWQISSMPSPDVKNPRRSGPFRQAFYHHMVFIYGTAGTPEENAWCLARARYDAEGFWYRGNGSVGLISDQEYLGNPTTARAADGSTRSVILYGHADCNAAWPTLLGASPVQVHRGSVRLGERELTGGDLTCLFVQPNRRDDLAMVGVVSGTGLPGLRMTERFPYFLAGAGFPDCLVASPEMLTKGTAGIRAAGFFGPDWQVGTGEFAWPE